MIKKYSYLLFSAIAGVFSSTLFVLLYSHFEFLQVTFIPLVIYWITLVILIIFLALFKIGPFRKLLFLALSVIISPYFVKWQLNITEPYIFLVPILQKLFLYNSTIHILICEFIVLQFPTPQNHTTINSNNISCKSCGHFFSPKNVFCPNCYKISDSVHDTFTQYKNKRFLDFTVSHNGPYLSCPHCNSHYQPTIFHSYGGFDCPIIFCSSCKSYFVNNKVYEWALISLAGKIHGVVQQFITIYIFTYIFVFGLSFFLCEKIAIISVLVTFLIAIPLNAYLIHSEITASKQRIQNNPDYPNILAKMGYDILADHYNHVFKSSDNERK